MTSPDVCETFAQRETLGSQILITERCVEAMLRMTELSLSKNGSGEIIRYGFCVIVVGALGQEERMIKKGALSRRA